jgi:hypothetical protein
MRFAPHLASALLLCHPLSGQDVDGDVTETLPGDGVKIEIPSYARPQIGDPVELGVDLGHIYEKGLGVEPSPAAAARWYASAAGKEYAPA